MLYIDPRPILPAPDLEIHQGLGGVVMRNQDGQNPLTMTTVPIGTLVTEWVSRTAVPEEALEQFDPMGHSG